MFPDKQTPWSVTPAYNAMGRDAFKLPQLVHAGSTIYAHPRNDTIRRQITPISSNNSYSPPPTQPQTTKHKRKKKCQKLKITAVIPLSTMDQRILVLYKSKLQRLNESLSKHDNGIISASSSSASAEENHAALTLQRVYRGHLCRLSIHAYFGPINQSKALLIQRHFRAFLGRRRFRMLHEAKRFYCARCIQCWIRCMLARQYMARLIVFDSQVKILLLQRIYRGFRGRCRARHIRFQLHTKNVLHIQRVYRGYRGRTKVIVHPSAYIVILGRQSILKSKLETQLYARAMALASQRHAVIMQR
jgi:hypothetical protein